MKRRILASHVLVFAILISLPAGSALAAPPSDAELLAKVDVIAADFLSRPGGVGLSVGVARDGRVVVARGYGLADVEFEARADKDTMFRIGSITKQFTAAAIMRLVEQGSISLDDNLNTYLPDYPTQGHTVTIRHLLNHTSGIRSYTSVGEEWEKLWPLELSHDQLLALVKDRPFDFKPGEKWAYNNTAYYLLGMIIEKISGKSYAKHMQDEFFTPLKLERTRYDSSSDIIRNRAQGYSLRDGELTNDVPLGMSQPGAAGGLLSTGEELVEWSVALTSGKVVSTESFEQMIMPVILPDGKSTEYGFGLGIDEWEDMKRIQHGGGIHGFNSMLFWLPDHDLHIAVVSNGEPVNSGRIAVAVAAAATGIAKSAAKDEPVSPELAKTISGMYAFEQIEMKLKVWQDGDKVIAQGQAEGQGVFRLMFQGAGVNPEGEEFRADFDHDMKVIFARDGQSLTLFQNGNRMTGSRQQ